MLRALCTLRELTCLTHPPPAVFVHPYFGKPAFDRDSSEILDGFRQLAVFARVQLLGFLVVPDDATCALQLV